MMIYLIILCVAVLLGAGIWLILKSYRSAEEESLAVPISDPRELHVLQKNLPSMTVQKNITMVPGGTVVPPDTDPMKELREKMDQVVREKDDLRLALEKEIALHSVHSLTEEERLRWKETSDQLAALQASLQKLSEENTKSQTQMETMRAQLKQTEEKNCMLLKECADLRQAEQRLLQMEREYERLKESEKTEHGLRDRLSDDQIRQNQTWNEKEKRYEEKISELKQMLVEWEKTAQERQMKWEEMKKELQSQNVSLAARLQDNEHNMVMLKSRMADVEANKREPAAAPVPASLEAAKFSADEEKLLKERIRQLEEFNEFLLAKDRKLQYELTKNRAQTLGLERICEDLKRQMETSQHRTGTS